LRGKKLNTLDGDDKFNMRSIVSRNGQERDILIGCNNLLDLDQAISLMKEQIDIDFINYYNYIQWPIINESNKIYLHNYIKDKPSIRIASSFIFVYSIPSKSIFVINSPLLA